MERRPESGGFLPSSVLLLSVAALVMAGVTFVVTQDKEKTEASQVTNVTADPTPTGSATPKPSVKPSPTEKPEVVVDRAQIRVEVYNTSAIKGLAADVNDRLGDLGWDVGTPDNWDGTFPESTVYYAAGLSTEAEQLALDLGIDLVKPALGQMITDGLSVILTGPLDS